MGSADFLQRKRKADRDSDFSGRQRSKVKLSNPPPPPSGSTGLPDTTFAMHYMGAVRFSGPDVLCTTAAERFPDLGRPLDSCKAVWSNLYARLGTPDSPSMFLSGTCSLRHIGHRNQIRACSNGRRPAQEYRRFATTTRLVRAAGNSSGSCLGGRANAKGQGG